MSELDPVILLQKQCRLFQLLQNFMRNSVDKIAEPERTVAHFQARLALLEKYWLTFFERHENLIEFENEFKSADYYKEDCFSQGELLYISTITDIKQRICALQVNASAVLALDNGPDNQQVNNNNNRAAILAQPFGHSQFKLNLPKFNGLQSEWESFKELFTAMVIADNRYSDVVKLQHLMNSVEGSAAQALKGTKIIAINFKVAWDKLTRRYDNKNVRLNAHLDALFALPVVKTKSALELSLLLDRVEEAYKGLEELNCAVESFDIWLVYLINKRLDPETRESWAISQEKVADFSTYKAIRDFLELRIRTLEEAYGDGSSVENLSTESKVTQKARKSVSVNASQSFESNKGQSVLRDLCFVCSGKHYANRCEKFRKMSVTNRKDLVKSNNRCFNCLSKAHGVAKCSSKFRCVICNEKHHSMLHSDRQEKSQTFKTTVSRSGSVSSQEDLNSRDGLPDDVTANMSFSGVHVSFSKNLILLATAQITLQSESGDRISVRALVDPCAERSIVSQRVVSALSLKVFRSNTTIKGVGGTIASKAASYTTLYLKSNVDRLFSVKFSALIMGKLSSRMPHEEVLVSDWSHLRDLELADPEFMKPLTIDCILGADVYPNFLLHGVRSGPPNSPIAQQTRLGWVLTGSVFPKQSHSHEVKSFSVQTFFTREELSISEALAKFWEVEKIPAKTFFTEDEKICENHFIENYSRQENGRYMVRLCFKSIPSFPGSRDIALRLWKGTENRLSRNSELKSAYDRFMREYLDLGHMELVPCKELENEKVYYLPHHAVFRNNKIRVVFNASMPSFSGIALNDSLHVGAKLQQDIVLVMIRWRFYKFVFSTDIVKMFRQIAIHPSDRDWLRILYKFADKIQHYRLCTVTYGTASAPFQALRVLRQIVHDLCSNDWELSDLFLKLSYVDDFFAGADTIESLMSLRDRLVTVLSRCQIDLGKWSANREEVLSDLSNVSLEQKSVDIAEVVSALGLKWSPVSDEFFFTVDFLEKSSGTVTKRTVLSVSSKFFDPLGWLSPTLIRFKMFMQDLWIHGLDWDVPLSGELLQSWNTLKAQVLELSLIKIPRWYGSSSDSSWSLHGFADASKRAYAACVYFVPQDGSPFLVCSKVRVAPVKTLSIPKLELLGAATLAKLIEWILPCFPVQPAEIHCWSDSRNVLCLLRTIPAKLKVFESNKVSDIITILPNVRWKYVPTKDNPADCATRGLSAAALKEFSLWWSGPSWLQDRVTWPRDIFESETSTTDVACHVVNVADEKDVPWFARFSSFCRLVRVTAICRRWLRPIKYLRLKRQGVVLFRELEFDGFNSVLTAEELSVARERLLLWDQNIHFKEEIALLSDKERIKKGCLSKLTPFLDKKGILRVGGRLEENPFLSFQEKHPIILSKLSYLSRILIQETHRFLLHGGPKLILSCLYRKFWIIHGKRLVTSILQKCPVCLRFSGRFVSQKMADLPEFRQKPDFPFNLTGVDYAGPIKVTHTKGRGISSSKGYICVFICLVTKAVHIEIVSDLSSDAFLAAFERFSARRGLPSRMYSDNGTTFQGANNEIKKLFAQSSSVMHEICESVENRGVTWSFIPPHAPHFGGMWESAVKSFKHHFKRVIGDSSFTYEELSTLAAQIESCLNSRPLCAVSLDSRDSLPLTPGHFLVGRMLKTLPPSSNVSDLGKSYKTRWLSLLAMRNNFWSKWRKEVFSQLMQRQKWLFPRRSLEVGDIVIIRDDLAPPACWPMGKVIKVHPGRDNLVRVVSVKTESSTLNRPVHKLIYLPVDDQAVKIYNIFLKELGSD